MDILYLKYHFSYYYNTINKISFNKLKSEEDTLMHQRKNNSSVNKITLLNLLVDFKQNPRVSLIIYITVLVNSKPLYGEILQVGRYVNIQGDYN